MSAFTCERVARAVLGEPHHVSAGEAYRTCPNHDDRHPSLQINDEKNVWMCGPCGASGNAWQLAAFLARLDPNNKPGVTTWLRERGLLDGRTNGNGTRRTAQSEKRRVAEFYYSADLRKVRLEPGENGKSKMFVWEHREGDKWKSGDGGKHKPLYVNQTFRDADQLDYALGFEGEGKSDLAGELGIAGFSYKCMEESECKKLEGLKIFLWADRDAAGRTQVQEAAQKIHDFGHPRSIAIITPPPELPVGGDIVDAVKALGLPTNQELQRLSSNRNAERSNSYRAPAGPVIWPAVGDEAALDGKLLGWNSF
jgi:CHC2 zinc finger